MFKKVVKVTEENKLLLMDRYGFADEEIDAAVESYLVADFGESTQTSFINGDVLKDSFTATGRLLESGFVEYRVINHG